jgi:Spy/CpxP family protein refolding chaperone
MIARTMKAKALVFAIFMAGIAIGALLTNLYSTRLSTPAALPAAPAADRAQATQKAQRDINKFYDYLGLNQEQRDQMHKIGEETRHEFQDLRKETQPRFVSIQDKSREKIRAILTDEQRTKYDEFRKNMAERRRERDSNNKGPNKDSNKNDRDPDSGRGPQSN